jgi:protein-S-isoprenylcysteine O-methyltransferase
MDRQSTSSSASRQSSAQASGHSAPASEGESVRRSGQATAKDDSIEGEDDRTDIQSPFTSTPFPFDPSLLPEGKRSLSSISTQSFWLGIALTASVIFGVEAAWKGYTIWRPFAFIGSLALFHFLEFWVTATYNVPVVRASSFLLFTNGTPYNVAHSFAMLEILFSNYFFPSYQARYANFITISIGLFLVIFGQACRTLAMATAGTNFNHTPQKTKQNGHELVTSGIYAYSRHPSYFAFFWWAVGTQMLVGNKICLVAFFAFLWHFFYNRIKGMFFLLAEAFCVARRVLRPSTQLRSGIWWSSSAKITRTTGKGP